MQYDVFICHATEDKQAVVAPLVKALQAANVSVWYDQESLVGGEMLLEALQRAIDESRLAVVVFSDVFFRKHWTQEELKMIFESEAKRGRIVLFPVLHGVSYDDIKDRYHLDSQQNHKLDERYCVNASEGVERIVSELLRALSMALVPVVPTETHPCRWTDRRTGVSATLTSVAFGTLLCSGDLGRSWMLRPLGIDRALRCVVMSGSDGWIAGDGGTVLRTGDGGATWRPFDIGTTEDVTNVAFCEGARAACLTLANGDILRISGGSRTAIASGVTEYPWHLRFGHSGELGCLSAGGGKILVSLDAGRSWHLTPTSTTSPFYACAVGADGVIWIVGDEGMVCSSDTQGRSWTRVKALTKANPWDTWLNACDFSPSGQLGIIAGSQGTVVTTSDAGRSWNPARLMNRMEIVNLAFCDESSLFGVGYFGSAIVADWTGERV
jgi:photosystem II stability/assembly factor-like uncharacterized protein